MDWLDRMNSAIDYIEANLTGVINMVEVSRRACCSEYHFTRMFSFITGITLNEYIRSRRLTMAGFELKNSDIRIIELANKYGYDSPNSFTRAFQTMHGVTSSIEKPGEDSIISIWKRIFPEWFPNSGYELDSGPRQERCYWREDGKVVVEAWVPVVKAKNLR